MNKVCILLLLCLLCGSCRKEWLEAKSDKALVVPKTLQDGQALLDNVDLFNQGHPALGELGSDDYYLEDATWSSLLSATERNAYRWTPDVYEGERVADWERPYQQVLYANTVLQLLDGLAPGTGGAADYNQVQGSALFYRAYAFYNLAQLFCAPYQAAAAERAAGIPLKRKADISEPVGRGSVEETYRQIERDLLQALPLLPQTPLYKTRPSKAAAYGLLARLYRSMQDYSGAQAFADSALQINGTLLDYNTLSAAAANPVPRLNAEVVFHATLSLYSAFLSSRLVVDSTLYSSYAPNDLRRTLFFREVGGRKTFKGSYGGSLPFFGGLANDELYLIRAECLAREGEGARALADLNRLLEKRWKRGSFSPLTATDSEEALRLVLAERRKELLFRGLRWTDLRRGHTDSRLARTLTRVLNGEVYTLPAGDPRYTLPLPDNEVRLSGLAQNPR